MVWVLIGALGVFIAQDLALNATQKGFMVAVPLLGGSMSRIVLGLCTDRFGPRRRRTQEVPPAAHGHHRRARLLDAAHGLPRGPPLPRAVDGA